MKFIHLIIVCIGLVRSQSVFRGNRTFYPSLKPRPEAALADINYENSGNGIVTILNPYARAVSSNTKSLQQQRALWASMNQVRILYRNFNEAETYDDYVDQVLMSCNFSETTSFDIIWVNASMNGVLSKCLLDLYAWDFNIGDGHDPNILSNSIVENRLVTLPSEASLLTLVSNQFLLLKYEYSENPKSLDEIETMCNRILMNEKAMDNYKITCITGAFGNVNEFFSIIVTWLASVNGQIISGNNVTVSSDETASILNKINDWVDSGIILLDNLEKNSIESTLSQFSDGNAVFMFAQLPQINYLNQNPPYFEWSISPFPGSNSNFIGTLNGWSLGVYKFSRNPTAAIKTIKWMTSEDTQKNAILLSNPVLLLPTRPKIYENSEVCNSMGQDLCNKFSKITPVIPPWQLAGKKFYNMSILVTEIFRNIIIREIDVNSGLENLYLILKSTFNLDGKFAQIDVPFRPVKKGYSHLTLQVWILSVVCTLMTLMAVAYRLRYAYLVRKRNMESAQSPDNQKPPEFLQMASLKVGNYNFHKLEEETDN